MFPFDIDAPYAVNFDWPEKNFPGYGPAGPSVTFERSLPVHRAAPISSKIPLRPDQFRSHLHMIEELHAREEAGEISIDYFPVEALLPTSRERFKRVWGSTYLPSVLSSQPRRVGYIVGMALEYLRRQLEMDGEELRVLSFLYDGVFTSNGHYVALSNAYVRYDYMHYFTKMGAKSFAVIPTCEQDGPNGVLRITVPTPERLWSTVPVEGWIAVTNKGQEARHCIPSKGRKLPAGRGLHVYSTKEKALLACGELECPEEGEFGEAIFVSGFTLEDAMRGVDILFLDDVAIPLTKRGYDLRTYGTTSKKKKAQLMDFSTIAPSTLTSKLYCGWNDRGY